MRLSPATVLLTVCITLTLALLAWLQAVDPRPPLAQAQGVLKPAQATETPGATITTTATLTATLTLTPVVTTTATTEPNPTAALSPPPSPSPTAVAYHKFLPWLARLAPDYPGAPILNITRGRGDKFDLVWTPADRATVYTLLQSAMPDFAHARVVFRQGVSGPYSHTVALAPGAYYFRVVAANFYGRTASNDQSLRIEATPTGAPVSGIWRCWPSPATQCGSQPSPTPLPTFIPTPLPTETAVRTPAPTATRVPTSATLRSVTMLSASEGWAVGEGGVIVHFDGSTWSRVPHAAENFTNNTRLNAISMVSSRDGWAVGQIGYGVDDQGLILHWDGVTWRSVTTDPPSELQRASLASVSMLSPDDGWIVGGNPGGSLILHWDGQHWTRIASPVDAAADVYLNSVTVLPGADGWAVGWQAQGNNTSRGIILRRDGLTWRRFPGPAFTILPALDAVALASPTDGWIVSRGFGELGNWLLHWDGSVWTRQEPSPRLFALAVVSPTDVWGGGGYDLWHWDGQTWRDVFHTASPATLMSMAMVSATDGWAVGGEGQVLHWDGQAWLTWPPPPPVHNPVASLRALALLSASDGWAVGDQGTLRHWDGQTWSFADSPVAVTLNGVALASTADGWAVGDQGIALHWDGAVWQRVRTPVSSRLNAVALLSASDGWAAGNDGVILRWDGAAWQRVSSPTQTNLAALSFGSASEGWAVGNDGVILRWDGQAWTQVATTMRADIVAVAQVGPRDAWAFGQVCGGGSLCSGLGYHWDGVQWSRVNLPTAAPLYDVAFASPTDGWAVGGHGQIAHWDGVRWSQEADSPAYPLPTPLFAKRDVRPTTTLRAVALVSSTEGWAVGDQGTLLHWDGQTWTGTSRLPLPSTPTSTPTPTPTPTLAPDVMRLNALAFLSPSEGWAVGDAGAILHWDGAAWSPVLSPTDLNLAGVAFASPTDGWAVGKAGTILHWDGRVWTVAASPAAGVNLHAVTLRTATDGWAVGGGRSSGSGCWGYRGRSAAPIGPSFGYTELSCGVILHWDGEAWRDVAPPASGPELFAVTAVSASEVWVAGQGWRYEANWGSAGSYLSWSSILRWDGAGWSEVYHDERSGLSLTAPVLRGIAASAPSQGWAVGDGGTLVARDGQSWRQVDGPTTAALNAVTFPSAGAGWAVGEQGVILQWDGAAWQSVASPVTSYTSLRAVAFLAPHDGWAVGDGVILRYQPSVAR